MVSGDAHSLTQKILPHLEKKKTENYIKFMFPNKGHLIIIFKLCIERKRKRKRMMTLDDIYSI
jgi:hypothetical protein